MKRLERQSTVLVGWIGSPKSGDPTELASAPSTSSSKAPHSWLPSALLPHKRRGHTQNQVHPEHGALSRCDPASHDSGAAPHQPSRTTDSTDIVNEETSRWMGTRSLVAQHRLQVASSLWPSHKSKAVACKRPVDGFMSVWRAAGAQHMHEQSWGAVLHDSGHETPRKPALGRSASSSRSLLDERSARRSLLDERSTLGRSHGRRPSYPASEAAGAVAPSSTDLEEESTPQRALLTQAITDVLQQEMASIRRELLAAVRSEVAAALKSSHEDGRVLDPDVDGAGQ